MKQKKKKMCFSLWHILLEREVIAGDELKQLVAEAA